MEDARIWEFERDLWLGGAQVYRERVAAGCLLVLPAEPFLFDIRAATEALDHAPRWETVEFAETRVERPQEGLIVLAYRVRALRDGERYHALCSSTLRRLAHDRWEMIQHQQTPFGMLVLDPDAG